MGVSTLLPECSLSVVDEDPAIGSRDYCVSELLGCELHQTLLPSHQVGDERLCVYHRLLLSLLQPHSLYAAGESSQAHMCRVPSVTPSSHSLPTKLFHVLSASSSVYLSEC